MILLQDSVNSASDKIATACAEDISTMLINSRRERTETHHLSDIVWMSTCVLAGVGRHPIYEVDFGWGKPCWVSHASKAFEGIALLDAKTGNGIVAWITLTDKVMIEFKQIVSVLETLVSVLPK